MRGTVVDSQRVPRALYLDDEKAARLLLTFKRFLESGNLRTDATLDIIEKSDKSTEKRTSIVGTVPVRGEGYDETEEAGGQQHQQLNRTRPL